MVNNQIDTLPHSVNSEHSSTNSSNLKSRDNIPFLSNVPYHPYGNITNNAGHCSTGLSNSRVNCDIVESSDVLLNRMTVL